ncbi:nucleotidyltransferase family protein [Aliiglaciecola sp. SL4]|uniref:nucleotidyltransferase family protein n=1 Tax=Aliiglaciecola sp. SL4 TaxID=3239806 RepID=UPI00355BF542
MLRSTEQIEPKSSLLSKLLLTDPAKLQSLSKNDVEELTELAIEHGVAALLVQVLQQRQLKTPLLSSLADFQLHQDMRNQLIEQQYQQTLIQLTKAEINFVVLKGYALGYTVYNNPSLRTKSDVDIIINSDNKNEIVEAFETMGFRNPRGWSPTALLNQFSMRKTLSPGLNVDFDIHLRLSNELGIENILTFDELMDSADTSTLQNIPLVSKPHGLIHAIVHLLHHRNVGDTVKLIWLYDLVLLCQKMSQLEINEFRKNIDEKGLGTLSKFALDLANVYFEDESIQNVLNSLDGASSNPELLYLTTIDSRTQQLQRSLQQRKSLGEKWLFIKEMAFPPAQEIYQKYGKKPPYLLPFYYLRRLIGGVIKYLAN